MDGFPRYVVVPLDCLTFLPLHKGIQMPEARQRNAKTCGASAFFPGQEFRCLTQSKPGGIFAILNTVLPQT